MTAQMSAKMVRPSFLVSDEVKRRVDEISNMLFLSSRR